MSDHDGDISDTSSDWQSYVTSSSEVSQTLKNNAIKRLLLASRLTKISAKKILRLSFMRNHLRTTPARPLSVQTHVSLVPSVASNANDPPGISSSTTELRCDNAHASLDTERPSIPQTSPYDVNEHENDPYIYLFPPAAVITQPRTNLHVLSRANTMQATPSPNATELLVNLSSSEDATRKMAAFKLQSLINDPAFAELFVALDGLTRLRELILATSGNTLAYGLASFARLLEVDQGWDGVDSRVVQKAVELVVCEPLVNILRGALSVLVSIVSRPHPDEQPASTSKQPYIGGFKALKPAIALHPQFLEMLVSRLSSADHSLCANALQLINSLMRDAIMSDNEQEWPKFIKRIQDLGVIRAVYILMQSSALQDLAVPLLDFQGLTKILLRRWRGVPVDLTKPEHRRTIKALHLSSNPEKSYDFGRGLTNPPKHNPNKWRRLGFTTESPEPDFEETGFLGMMDLSDYIRKHQDEFQHILLEQANVPIEKRCPVARASLVVTSILFEHFEVEKTELEDTKNYLGLESRSNFDAIFKPLLLHWSRLHVAGLHAFLRLWKATGAELEDFLKIVELIRILVESVVGGAERTKGIEQIEQDLASYECSKLRELQMELLELTYEDIWGQHLRSVRDELRAESLQFVKEQRIRCLLEGAWFPDDGEPSDAQQNGSVTDRPQTAMPSYRFIRLSPDRKHLYFSNFEQVYTRPPSLNMLHERIDLSVVSSVVSNVTASDELGGKHSAGPDGQQQERYTTTKISIHGYPPESRSKSAHSKSSSHNRAQSRASKNQKEVILLTFQPENHKVASEWLDGLLMLLEQQPITAETNKLISMIIEYGLKVRLLNVRFNDEEGLIEGMEAPPVPSRDGLDEDYYYEI